MKLKLISALATGLLCAAPAFSTTLDFQGAGAYNYLGDFYNGGTNDDGASGPNYGIAFGPDAVAITNDPDFPIYSNVPNPGVLGAVGPDAAMNVASGFSGAVSFWYSATENTSVTAYSGLNGTGLELGTFSLLANAQNGCSDTTFCHWDFSQLTLDGVAQSIQFSTTAGVAAFDNVTVNQVPLPAAAWLMLSAFGGLGAVRRKQKLG